MHYSPDKKKPSSQILHEFKGESVTYILQFGITSTGIHDY